MTTPTIRDLCAALSGDVAYLLDCIRDGGSDPVALQECRDHANTARDLLVAEPVGEVAGERIVSIAKAVQECAFAHGPDARLIGNVCAEDVADLCAAVLARWGRLTAPPAPEVQRDAVIAAVTEALGGAYDCLRVWEAWSVGTMGEDDFALVAEDPDRVAKIADAAIEAIRPAAPAAPSERDVAEWINGLPLWNGATRDELTGIVLRAFARWGRPAAPHVGEVGDRERLRIVTAGIRYGYTAGHEDTVEACYGDPDEVAADHAPEILGELGIAPPAPEPPAEALAARPLLEQMVRMVNRPAAPTWGELLTLGSRAAAWLEENPPGQPVRIEPRDCPIPGACSCVEPTPPAPEAGDVGEDRWYPGFADWLKREMPEGTVIGDPLWWASKIASYLTREARLAAPKIPAEGEAGEVVEWLRQRCNLMNPKYEGYEIVMLTRTYTLLEQQSAPAPAVVPVPVTERLPGVGDCDAEGFCWSGYGYCYDDKNEIDSYAMWMLVPATDLRGRVWASADAIPLPQGGEVEG